MTAVTTETSIDLNQFATEVATGIEQARQTAAMMAVSQKEAV